MNNDKCTKYESLFVFSDEGTLNKHIEECESCKEEQYKMDKVSELISEVKSHYIAKKTKLKKLRAICAVMLLLFFAGTFGIFYTDNDLKDALMYGDTLSAEDLGFPVDSYGLLMVDE